MSSVISVVNSLEACTVLTIKWLNQEWELLAEKALHWPSQRGVIVSDVHFGKAAAFRHHGVPVPEAATAHDLARLSAIIQQTRCEQLFVLGDLLHALHGRARQTMQSVTAWRAKHAALEIILVRGNHDHAAGDPPPEWRMRCLDEPHVVAKLNLRHVPSAGGNTPGSVRAPSIAGHLHPCVRLRDVDGSSLRVPCFVFSDDAVLLPAFGSFTGTHPVRPRNGDRVFAINHGLVREMTTVRA